MEAERQRPYRVEDMPYDTRLPRKDNPSTIVETAVQVNLTQGQMFNLFFTLPHTEEVAQAVSTLHSISRATILFLDQITKFKRAAPERGDLPVLTEPRPNFSQPEWATHLFSKYKLMAEFGENEFEEFKKFFWSYNAMVKPNFLSSAVGRFGQASDMAGDLVNLENRFIHYMRSLEALLGGRPEITRTLALRTAALVGGPPDNKMDTYDFIRGAYAVRSESVHGGGLPCIKVRGKYVNTGYGPMEDVDMLHWYCRVSIRRVVDLILGITNKEPTASNWKGMSDDDKKRWVVGLLDCSLVRDDLANALEAFYNGKLDVTALWDNYESSRRLPFNALSFVWHV